MCYLGISSIEKKPLPPWNSTGKPTFQRQVFSKSESTSTWFSQPVWTNLPQRWMFFPIFRINITNCLNRHHSNHPSGGSSWCICLPKWSSAEFRPRCMKATFCFSSSFPTSRVLNLGPSTVWGRRGWKKPRVWLNKTNETTNMETCIYFLWQGRMLKWGEILFFLNSSDLFCWKIKKNGKKKTRISHIPFRGLIIPIIGQPTRLPNWAASAGFSSILGPPNNCVPVVSPRRLTKGFPWMCHVSHPVVWLRYPNFGIRCTSTKGANLGTLV